MLKHYIKNFVKGIAIGIATIVPGVSGGTMALILGIYDNIISAISNFFKDIKKNTVFLLVVGIGGIIGILLFGQIVKYGLNKFLFPVTYLFLGIVLGGLPVLYNEAKKSPIKITDLLWVIIGFIIIISMTFYKGTIVNLSDITGPLSFLFLFVTGIVIAIALILPGISTSFLLLTLGLYDKTIDAIKMVDVNYLLPILLGTAFGIIATTKILDRLMKEKTKATYLIIMGFVIGSIIEVFPGIPGGLDVILSIITLISGFLIIRYVSKNYSD